MKNYILGLALMGMIYGATACSNAPSNNTEIETVNEEVPTIKNPKFADEKINSVYQHYLHLKTALINDDFKEAEMGAQMLNKALKDADIDLKNITPMINAVDVKAKRAQLSSLSLELASIFKKSKMESGVVYKQYCPMANGGKGGYWLASESQIKNPYYGKSMIGCGSVEEKIK
jgi:hypothetical protein